MDKYLKNYPSVWKECRFDGGKLSGKGSRNGSGDHKKSNGWSETV